MVGLLNRFKRVDLHWNVTYESLGLTESRESSMKTNTGQNRLDMAYRDLEKFLKHRVTQTPMHRMAYSRDWSPRQDCAADFPDIVVIPKTTEEMVRIAQIAYQYEIPIVPFGGGTGMGGGTVAWQGGIMVETKGMNQVMEIDEENMTATVQTGMTIWELNENLSKKGLWFPHQPESKRSCTIGASIGCDSDSTFGVRYGKIKDYLTNAVIVTGRAEAVRVGQRKVSFSSTGYKLLDLLVGSEGTLGVVTEATLRILPLPQSRQIRGYFFRSLNEAAKGLERVLASGLTVESAHINCRHRLHFYTHTYREKFGREPNVPEWAEVILFLSFAGDKEIVDFTVATATQIIAKGYPSQPIEEKELVEGWWDSKHRLEFIPFKQKWPDSQRQKKFGSADLGLPIGRLDEGYRHYIEIAKKWDQEILGMTVYNESPNKVTASISFAVFVDDSNAESVNKFYQYVKDMSEMAVALEGTMSTYIGDGDRLGGFNQLEHGVSLDYMRRIKEIFDPKDIMNPGKKFESRWIKGNDDENGRESIRLQG
jgi:glycolate oxidase